MARKRHSEFTQEPIVGQASVDSVLEYLGVSSPSLASQLLATLGMLIISIGALVTGPLQPIPLYSCWGALGYQDYPRSTSCSSERLLPSTPLQSDLDLWQCRIGAPWFSFFSIMAGLLVFVRILFSILAGIFLDVHGRRRVTIVAMGIYFVFALARSFAPNVEVAIIAIVVEGSVVQTASFGLILIVLENSIQKEAMRSVCLVLIGHCIGVSGVSTTIDVFLKEHLYAQLARSLPSAAFVLLVCCLPESIRWVLMKGSWVDASFLFPKTHNQTLDENIKPKLIAAQQESQRCLASAGCQGAALRRSVAPIFRDFTLLRSFLILFLLSGVYGYALGVRMVLDPSPYTSFPDRSLAFGLTELVVLLFMGLVLVGARSCPGEVFVSLLSHALCVVAGVSLIVSMGRLCPTHSRGMLMGLCWAAATAMYSSAGAILGSLDASNSTIERYSLKVYISAGVCLLSGLSALLLPVTPNVLPDSLSHISKNYPIPEDNSDPFRHTTTVENTKF